MANRAWSRCERANTPAAADLHLVEVRLPYEEDLAWMRLVLDAEENLKASRMRDAHLMRTFMFAHAAVRIFFSGQIGVSPDQLIFYRTPLGRPGLRDSRSNYDFNISYRKGLVAFGVSKKRIGVDVELLPAGVRHADIARRFFSPEECRYVFASDADEERRFLRVWTRKEALIKYLALGIDAIGQFEVLSDQISVPGHRTCRIETSFMPGHVLSYACEV